MLEINTFEKIDWEKIYLEAIKIWDKNPDQLISVEIKKYKWLRTLNQNSYLWGVVYKYIADYTWYSTDEIHEEMKLRFLREDIKLDSKKGEITFHKFRSSTELNTAEFTKYIEDIKDFAAMYLWIIIPEPNEENILNSYKN